MDYTRNQLGRDLQISVPIYLAFACAVSLSKWHYNRRNQVIYWTRKIILEKILITFMPKAVICTKCPLPGNQFLNHNYLWPRYFLYPWKMICSLQSSIIIWKDLLVSRFDVQPLIYYSQILALTVSRDNAFKKLMENAYNRIYKWHFVSVHDSYIADVSGFFPYKVKIRWNSLYWLIRCLLYVLSTWIYRQPIYFQVINLCNLFQ